MLVRRLLLAALLLVPARLGAQQAPPEADRRLAREILAELVAINTTQDSGATRAARALARRLTAAGFPARDVQLAGPKPRKQNLVVRLRGKGSAKPILFLAHLDVVEARREDWTMDPFRLTERDGWLYGRGTSDIKDEAFCKQLVAAAASQLGGLDILVNNAAYQMVQPSIEKLTTVGNNSSPEWSGYPQ